MPFDSSPSPPNQGNIPTPTLPHQGAGSKNRGEDTETLTPQPLLPTWERGLGGEGKAAPSAGKQGRLSPPNQGNTPTPTLPHQGGGSKNRGGEDTETPTLAPLLPTWERGLGGEGKPDRWEIPPALREKMKQRARQFRKQPTKSEAILWQAIRNRKLEGRKFRRQQPIGSFVVDFFCANEKLIVEVDGLIHESQKVLDQQRQELLESLGLRFVRLSSHQVETDLPGALEIICQAFTSSSPSPIKGEGEKTQKPSPPSPLSQVGRGAGGEGKTEDSTTDKESC